MSEPWLQFYAAADVRELDRRAIEDHGIPGYTLMQRAAASAWQIARRAWGLPDRLVVFCGSGNNGGNNNGISKPTTTTTTATTTTTTTIT
ncbi:NAD(P)H-hydrate epimerase, partial [Algiphilus sp.]|uniref:NAD(P)H-hydrate epimerase n=1 Tax=Algiphilus sp. TaxID=1872431 RepID=UPI003C5BBFE3